RGSQRCTLWELRRPRHTNSSASGRSRSRQRCRESTQLLLQASHRATLRSTPRIDRRLEGFESNAVSIPYPQLSRRPTARRCPWHPPLLFELLLGRRRCCRNAVSDELLNQRIIGVLRVNIGRRKLHRNRLKLLCLRRKIRETPQHRFGDVGLHHV